MLPNNFIFDRNLLLQRRSKSSNTLTKSDFLIKRSFDDIAERLDHMSRDFSDVLNLGCRKSYGSNELRKRYNNLIEADLSMDMFGDSEGFKVVVDEETLPFASNSFDLIISVLNLHSVNDLPGTFIQIKEMLKPNGVFIASIFGERNLLELREVLMETELEIFGGVSPRVMPVIELKQLGMLLQRAGFNMPVVDNDLVEVHYKHPMDLLHDLQNMGETNIMLNRNKKYLGKKFWKKFSENYIRKFSKDGDIVANFEILTLTAVK
jgi:NADH dehydrogenase [ubiquinone] 1 alpha subcomplex assembly factor 5